MRTVLVIFNTFWVFAILIPHSSGHVSKDIKRVSSNFTCFLER